MMDWLRQSLHQVRSFFRSRQLDQELDAEMAAHLELATEENIRRGMLPDEARRQALIQFGGVQQAKEQHRESRGLPLLEALLQDLRFALRMLRKSPGFAVIAVLALALGIGFSTIIFSIFYNGVLYPFPYRDAQRLTVIGIVDTQHNSARFREVYHLDEVAAFRKQSRTFEDIVAYSGWDVVYLLQNISEQVHGCVLTPNAMAFWGVPPLVGRGLSEQDALPDANPVVLLSYAFWKSRFQGDKSVLGTTMTLNKHPRTIIGVMPPRFGLFGADLYIPISWDRPEPSFAQAMDNNDPVYFFATGLVKRKVNRRTAAADIQVIAKQLAIIHPRDYPEHFQMTARPMNEVIVDDFRQTLFLLIAAVVLLLLISSSNVASLLLTHHTAREREIALRAALGASRGRLIRQLLVESLLLGMAGCLVGCFLAFWGLLLIRLVPGVNVPGEADMSLNLPVLFFALLLSILTTLLFGLSPAFLAVKKDLRTNLQTTGANVNASRRGARIRSGLVVGQVALSMLLLIFAGLMMRSFLAVTNFNPGMRTQGLLEAWIHIPAHQYESAASKRALYDQASSRVSTLPGVTHTAFSIGLPPLGGPRSEDVTIPGKPHDKHWTTAVDAVNEGYFPTVGLQLLRGQLLSANDLAGARRVAVVNTTLVKSFFGDEDPLGRQIKFNVFDQEPDLPHDAWFQIVGVVNELKSFDPQESVLPQAYIPFTCLAFPDRRMLVRSVTNPSLLINPLRQVMADLDPNIVVAEASTLDDELQKHVYMKPKFRLISFGTCAAIGLGLALIGLFGVMAYSVTLQTHEFGIRMALGAHAGNILTLVLHKGLLLVGSGILLGFLVSFFTVRILQSQLWGVSAFDPWTLTLAPLALVGAGLLACYLPARRATRVDPMIALRYE
jgi:putative ABC transport system permease protein